MTALRPETRTQARVHTGLLTDRDLPDLLALVERDPVVNAVLAARLDACGTLVPHLLGGVTVGVRRDDELIGACFSGGNLMPVGGDESVWPLLAQFVANRPRVCSSVVGRADAVTAFWTVLSRRWRARAVRASQPLLVLDRAPGVAPDPQVRPVRRTEIERYLPAAAAMFTEELGVSPYESQGGASFRARMAELVDAERAFALTDHRGQVVFKAEIGAVSRHTVQVQGVWVRPDLRRHGIGTACLASVVAHGLALAPTVSLYVNDFNVPARRVYGKLGMRQHATLSTVLL